MHLEMRPDYALVALGALSLVRDHHAYHLHAVTFARHHFGCAWNARILNSTNARMALSTLESAARCRIPMLLWCLNVTQIDADSNPIMIPVLHSAITH